MPYSIVHVPYPHELKAMSADELQAFMRSFLDAIPQRISQLAEAVREPKAYGRWKADFRPSSLGALGNWFAANALIEPRAWEEKKNSQERGRPMIEDLSHHTLTERTRSIAFDVGIYVGQIFMKKDASLQWGQLLDDKNRVMYGLPVLTKSGRVVVDPISEVTALALALALNLQEGTALWALYDRTLGRPIPHYEQIEAMLDSSIRALLEKYSRLPKRAHYRYGHYLTVTLQETTAYLEAHPRKAEDYFENHSSGPEGHDILVLWQEGGEYFTAHMDHGKAWDAHKFKSCPEAVAYYLLAYYGVRIK